MTNEKSKKKTSQMVGSQAQRELPGIAVDIAEDNRVADKLVDARTKELNNNPRNNKS